MTQTPSSLSGGDGGHGGRESSMAGDKGGSRTAYRTSNTLTILPTRSRGPGDSVLLTFSDENKPQKADGGGAVRAVLNGSGGSF
jgi:hypothetical protein